jgi:hypothetical protein
MAYSFDGTSQYLSVTTAPASSLPLTLACWFRVPQAQSTVTRVLINLGHSQDAAGSGTGFLRINIPPNGTSVSAVTTRTGILATSTVSASGVVQANTWIHVAAVFLSSTSRTIYATGSAAVTNTASVISPTVNNLAISAALSTSAAGYTAGDIAEVGVWQAALDSSEVRSLSQTVSPSLVRPQSLAFYAPLIRDLVDLRGGLAITNNNGATVADHPRVYA